MPPAPGERRSLLIRERSLRVIPMSHQPPGGTRRHLTIMRSSRMLPTNGSRPPFRFRVLGPRASQRERSLPTRATRLLFLRARVFRSPTTCPSINMGLGFTQRPINVRYRHPASQRPAPYQGPTFRQCLPKTLHQRSMLQTTRATHRCSRLAKRITTSRLDVA